MNKPPYQLIIVTSIFIIIGALIYSNTLDSPFHFDDEQDIVSNPAIRSPWNAAIWQTARPVSYFTFALNYAIHGLDVTGYHIFNIFIHIVNAVFVYIFIILLFRTPHLNKTPLLHKHREIAFISALIFLVHPLQTQAVTYIVQRMAALATLFYLLAIILYINGRITRTKRLRWICFLSALVATVAACLSKQTAYTLPAMILLIDFTFFDLSIKSRLKIVAAMMSAILILMMLFFSTQNFHWNLLLRTIPPQQGHPYSITGSDYILTQFHVVLTYIRLLFYPVNQNLDYNYPISTTLFDGATLLSGLSLAALVVTGIWLLKKYRLIGFGILWFFITLLIESSIYPLPNVIFEHRIYLPAIGACIAVVAGIITALQSVQAKYLRIGMALIILLFMGLTYNRNTIWASEYTLWSDVISKSPNNARAWSNRGKANFRSKRYQAALNDFTKSLALNAHFLPPLYNRGLTFLALNQYGNAVQDLSQLIAYRADDARAYYSRSIVYMKMGKLQQSFRDISVAILKDSTDALAFVQRGQLYVIQGRYQLAHHDYEQALKLDNRNVEALTNLAILYSKQSEFQQSIAYFNKAIQLSPSNPDILDNRGFAFFRQKKFDLARADYQATLELDSLHSDAYYHRGLLYAAIDSTTQALADFNNVIKIAPQYIDAYFQRALLYTKLNCHQKAIDDLNRVITAHPNHAASYINRGLNYAYQNAWHKAIADYSRAIELDASQQTAYLNRALAYYSAGEIRRAWNDITHLQTQGHSVYPQLVSQVRKAMKHKK